MKGGTKVQQNIAEGGGQFFKLRVFATRKYSPPGRNSKLVKCYVSNLASGAAKLTTLRLPCVVSMFAARRIDHIKVDYKQINKNSVQTDHIKATLSFFKSRHDVWLAAWHVIGATGRCHWWHWCHWCHW